MNRDGIFSEKAPAAGQDEDLLTELMSRVAGRKDAFLANKERIEARHAAAIQRARREARAHLTIVK